MPTSTSGELLTASRSRVGAAIFAVGVVIAAVVCGFVASRSSSVSPTLLVGLVGTLVLVGATAMAEVSMRGLLVGVVVGGHLVIGALVVRGALPTSTSLVLDAPMLVVLAISLSTSRQAWSPSLILASLFIGLVAVQCLNTDVPSISYALQGARPLALPAVVIIAVSRLSLGRRDLMFISGMAAAGWLVNIEFAMRQWLVGFTSTELAFIENSRSTFRVGSAIRLLGTMQSNQDFAFIAAVAIPLIAVLLLHMRGRSRRISVGILFALSVAVLFGSLVRSGLVGGVVGAIVATGLSATTRVSRRSLVVGGAIIVTFFWIIATVGPGVILPANQAQTVEARVASIFSPSEDHSVNARVQETWPAAFRVIEQHPLGAGPGSAGPLSQSAPNSPFGAVVPDDGYLLIAVQLGIPGLVLFVGMLVVIGLELLEAARQGVVIAAAALGSVVALMVGMATSSFWDLTSPAVLFAVIVGLGLRAGQVARKSQDISDHGMATS
jgi:hypothetical protein